MSKVRYLLVALLVQGHWALAVTPVWKVLKDPMRSLSIQQVVSGSHTFVISESSLFNFGFTSEAVWITTDLSITHGASLVIDNPLIRQVDFYCIVNREVVQEKHLRYLRDTDTGLAESSILSFEIPEGFNGHLYMRFESAESLIIPIKIIESTVLAKTLANKLTIGLLIAGSIFALVLLYMIFFISLRDRAYLYYWLYAITVIITVLRINGLLYYWFPFVRIFDNYSSIFETLPTITAGIFTIHFLKLRSHATAFYRIIYVMVLLQVLSIFVSLSGFNQVAFLLTDVIAIIFIPMAILLGYRMWIVKKFKPAKYYLLSWIFVFIGAVIYLSRNYGFWYSDNAFANHAIDLGIAFEMILLAVGLSKRVDQLRIDKEFVQAENIQILTKQKSELERLVAERTQELVIQNEEILQQQKQIEAINAALEETVRQRTLQLKEQNEQLMEYAYFNAHRVRGPLARILGLTNLARISKSDGHSEMIERIEGCAKELDNVIKEVNKSLTKMGSSPNDPTVES